MGRERSRAARLALAADHHFEGRHPLRQSAPPRERGATGSGVSSDERRPPSMRRTGRRSSRCSLDRSGRTPELRRRTARPAGAAGTRRSKCAHRQPDADGSGLPLDYATRPATRHRTPRETGDRRRPPAPGTRVAALERARTRPPGRVAVFGPGSRGWRRGSCGRWPVPREIRLPSRRLRRGPAPSSYCSSAT